MKKLSFLVFLLTYQISLAAPFQNFPGTIPLQYERQAASDLYYNGKKLLPDEARALYETGKIKDLSLLDPVADSNIWRDEYPQGSFEALDEIGLNNDYEELEYVSETPVPNGRFGFVAAKTQSNGTLRNYQVLLDVKGHNILLRKTLLRKIGYQIPPTIRVKKVRVKFKGAFSKREFVKELPRKAFPLYEPERWIVEGQDTDNTDLVVQDAIVFEGSIDSIYNMARGDMLVELVQGRRLFNALLVPFNLTDITESINTFPWNPGRIFNKQLLLRYEDEDQFSTSYEDARWITRRILKLTKQDWEQVVASAEYPVEVAKLVTEKLVARRNFLREKLGLDKESPELPVNSKISYGSLLVNGKLKGETWPGYAARFASADPSSPLEDGEMGSLVKSKIISNLISNVVSEFNSRFVPHTDLAWKILDHQLDVSAKQMAHFILTGELKEIPFGFWATPIYSGNLIAAREVVAGNYMGAENIVQLADTVGFAVDAGAYIGADGLPTKVTFSGTAKAFYVKTYTHLKPITSIKASLKEPFRNMMVPWLKKHQADPLDEIIKLEGQKEKLGEDVYNERIAEHLNKFKEVLGTGESLVIQTSIGGDLVLTPGYGFNENVRAYMNIKDRLTSLSRLHIYKKDDNTIQVYRDPALYNVFEISLGLEARIQILEIGWAWLKGTAKTEFFNFSVASEKDGNTQLFENAKAIRRVLRDNSVEVARKVQKPWIIDHDFFEKSFNFKFLFFRHQSSNVVDELKVTSPSGQSKDYIRRVIGKRSGRDYETLALEVLDSLVDEYVKLDTDINLASANNGNPGDTFKGRSVSRQVVLEAELAAGKKDLRTDDMFLGIEYRWKGWEINKAKAEKILSEISQKYGSQLFPSYALNDTKKIQFYSIDISIALYDEAIQRLTSLTEAQVKALYSRYSVVPSSNSKFRDAHLQLFMGYISRIKKSQKSQNARQEADALVKLVNHAESTMHFEGFSQAIGGIDNMFMMGTLRGFRDGAEDGDRDVFSHTLGQIGTLKPNGPLKTIKNQLGMSEGEMLIYWLLNRL